VTLECLGDVLKRLNLHPPSQASTLTYTRTRGMLPDLTETEAHQHEADIELLERSWAQCDDCPGLDGCKAKGVRVVAARMDGLVQFRATYCPQRLMRGAAERYERLLVASRMTKRFRERTFGNFVARSGTEAALDACHRFVEDYQIGGPPTRGVMLVGAPGTGKTHLMAACANALLDRGVRVIFACVPDVLADLRRAVGADALEDVVAELRECEVLCLDDLGAERVTDWAREQVYRLINYRYEAELPVLATSNLDADALAEQLGDRIVSRLAEMCVWVRMECDDYRLRKEVPA